MSPPSPTHHHYCQKPHQRHPRKTDSQKIRKNLFKASLCQLCGMICDIHWTYYFLQLVGIPSGKILCHCATFVVTCVIRSVGRDRQYPGKGRQLMSQMIDATNTFVKSLVPHHFPSADTYISQQPYLAKNRFCHLDLTFTRKSWNAFV